MADVFLDSGKIIIDQLGNAAMIEGLEAEEQIYRNAMLIFLGGWFADLAVGVDWTNILDKQFTIDMIKGDITRVLLAIPITQQILIISLSDVNPNREATLTFVVETATGNTVKFSEAL